MRIGIVGAGWYGSHLALSLRKLGHEITLFEKNPDIFSQISGNFGIRLHVGPHYPRSKKTRESCQRDFEKFIHAYPELVIEHDYSTYALGTKDSDNNPSKVDYETFKTVCGELAFATEIDVDEAGYHELVAAWNVNEPSIVVGEALREKFRGYLSEANINIVCNFTVKMLDQSGSLMSVTNEDGKVFDRFEYIINATSYQSFVHLKDNFPFNIDVVYQPCLALTYEDTQSTTRPFSFIVMDGWFPCMMPYCDKPQDFEVSERAGRKYIVTHGKWTIMGSCNTPIEAERLLSRIDDEFIETSVRPSSASEMSRFWPEFGSRFRFTGWKGSVLAKLKTTKEFRSAVTFEKDRLINIIPGKVSNIFDVEREVVALINQQNVQVLNEYKYVLGGVLDDALQEIIEIPEVSSLSTCNLQTHEEIRQSRQDEAVKKADYYASFWSSSLQKPNPAEKSCFSSCVIC